MDPIDGTKEFIKRNGEFTVNIALIDNQVPVSGVIFAPVLGDLYFSEAGVGSFKVNIDLDTFDIEHDLLRAAKLPQKRIFYQKQHISKERKRLRRTHWPQQKIKQYKIMNFTPRLHI